MNMFDEARALRGMISMCKMTQGEIAKKMGVSQSYVANKLRLLRFSDEVQRLILDSGLSERHARSLLRLSDEGAICETVEKIRERKLTVAESEAMVDMLVESKAAETLGIYRERERIEKFESFVNSSVASLVSLGINARCETSFYGKKRYIMISIEEGK